jgi:predicted amidophosphoribosyltransferase
MIGRCFIAWNFPLADARGSLITMIPTKTHGICGHCREANPYTEIKCVRCGERLPWAFLIDGKNDEDFEPPIEKSIEHFFHLDRPTHFNICCRFCNGLIKVDEKICPHCGKWLVSAYYSAHYGGLVDPDAPEIQRLVAAYEKEKTRWR